MPCVSKTGSKTVWRKPRHPERTLLNQPTAEHYGTWRAFACRDQFDDQGCAIAFIRRLGSNLNEPVHLKVACSLACRDRWTSRKRLVVAVSKRC